MVPGRHRRSHAQPVALIVGGSAGALLRYALTTTWPHPHQILMTTVLMVGMAFLISAFVLASGPTTVLSNVVLGLCASAASLSVYAVLTISASMRLSLAFLILTPAAAIAGLMCGLLVARVRSR